MKRPFSRRGILKSSAFTGAASLSTVAAAREVGLSPATLEACEKALGFDLTDDETAQALDLVEAELDGLRALQNLALENSAAPSLTFKPLPPSRRPSAELSTTSSHWTPSPLPQDQTDLAFASLKDQAHWIRTKQLTSQTLTSLYLERISRYGDRLECFITMTPKRALEQAKAADALLAKGTYLGPLHGIPYGLKDLADTAGIPTTWGAASEKSRIPDTDSVIYERLKAAGAVLLGKTTLGALAYGDQWFGGRTNNPWNLNEGSSGSSAGSAAAVAAGLVSFAIGSETMGSIISPCDRTGCAGLRPTFGRVARTGTMSLCWSLDKLGPLTRTVADTGFVLEAINGADQGDPSSQTQPFRYTSHAAITGLTVGYDPDWFEGPTAHDVDRAVLKTIKALGVTIKPITLPTLPYGSLGPILSAEAAAAFEPLTLSNGDEELVWQGKYAWPNTFRAARFYPAIALVQLDRMRRKIMVGINRAMADVDVLVHPSYAANLLQVGNFCGLPAAVIRGGFIQQPTRTLFEDDIKPERGEDIYDVPRSFSITGHAFDEALLLAFATILETALSVAEKRPPLSAR